MGKINGNAGTSMHLQALRGKRGPDPNRRDKRKCYHYDSFDGLCHLNNYRCPGSSFCTDYKADHVECKIYENGECIYDSTRPNKNNNNRICKFSGTKYIPIEDISVDTDHLDKKDYKAINRILNIYESDTIPWDAPPISVVIKNGKYEITTGFHIFMALKIAGCDYVRAEYGEKETVQRQRLLKTLGTEWKYRNYGICKSEGTYNNSIYLNIPGKGTMVYDFDELLKDTTFVYAGEQMQSWISSTRDKLSEEELRPLVDEYFCKLYDTINCNIFSRCLQKNVNPASFCDEVYGAVLNNSKIRNNKRRNFLLGDFSTISNELITEFAKRLNCDIDELYSECIWDWNDIVKNYVESNVYGWDDCFCSEDESEYLLKTRIFHCTGKDLLVNEVFLLLSKRIDDSGNIIYILAFEYGLGRNRPFDTIKLIDVHNGYWADYAEKCFKDFPDTCKEVDDSLFWRVEIVSCSN